MNIQNIQVNQIYWMMERKCNSFSNLRKRVVTTTETDEMET